MVCSPETGKDGRETEGAAAEPGCGPEAEPEDQPGLRHEPEAEPEDQPKLGNEPEAEPEDQPELRSGPEGIDAGRSFAGGFVAGIIAAALCVLIFLFGWDLARRSGVQHRDSGTSDGLGAEALTDYHTLSKLGEVQSLIEQHFLKDVDSETLSAYLFKGIAVGLGDDYSNYYSEQELTSVRDSARGEYWGIGATMAEDPQTHEISVEEVYEDEPAERAGLRAGDIVLSVDGVSAAEQGLDATVALIKSKEETFTLEVLRPDTQEELALMVECGDVELVCVSSRMLEDGVGYLRLTEFAQSAVRQFREAVQELNRQGMKKLIVDLRDNPGGTLDAVCEILDEILPEGLIVYTEDKDGECTEYRSDAKRSVTCAVAVLVNGNSASASEIFAGAVQDYGLGPVVGSQTYGKGVVQDTFLLSDGSAFKMTTQKYFTPAGQDIDGNGITPDIAAEEEEEGAGQPDGEPRDAALERALEALAQQD